VLGLLRDISTASLLGGGATMDALVIAFRIPNLLRRVLGEGALASSYIPVLAQQREHGEEYAWRLVRGLVTYLTAVLVLIAVVGELICGAIWLGLPSESPNRELILLTACLLPYLVLVCLWAQLAATLQTLGRFFAATFSSSILNVVWLVTAWWIAPRWCDTAFSRARFLAIAILLSGIVQLLVLLPPLRRAGFRWLPIDAAARQGLREIAHSTLPVAFGLAITQLQTLLDSLTAWLLASDEVTGRGIAWLGGWCDYPLHSGAAAAIYLGERFYQFPLGLIGVSVATVAYPLMARHVAAKNYAALADDLAIGLRMVWTLAIPCAVGLVFLAGPLSQLGFAHGEFTAANAARAATTIRAFGLGVPAFCVLPLIGRAMTACGDRRTLVRYGIMTMLTNLVLNVLLVWPLAEAGLALATSISATGQAAALLVHFSDRNRRLPWNSIFAHAQSVLIASLPLTVFLAVGLVLGPGGERRFDRAAWLSLTALLGAASYFVAARRLLPRELNLIFGGSWRTDEVQPDRDES
jgi:putative peptidoglycan lipid II flippase